MLSNKSQLELLNLSKRIVQPLLSTFHKGQAGRIAIIGGSEDYTGAPFFSAHSAALVGCDLSHIICEKNAAAVIKSYSPDLMVHPYLLDSSNVSSSPSGSASSPKPASKSDYNAIIDDKILPKISSLLNRIHLVVVGPGFGRDPLMLQTLTRIIEEVKVLNIPLILDADALYLVSQNPQLISGYAKAVLTPNVVEFGRLAKAVLGDDVPSSSNDQKDIDLTIRLSKELGGVTIVRKGKREIIVKGDSYVISEREGSVRRVGGQGDTLTGSIGTFIIWSNNYQQNLWGQQETEGHKLTGDELTLLACFAGSTVVRLASQRAYKKYGRAMQASNIHEFLGPSYSELFPDSFTKEP